MKSKIYSFLLIFFLGLNFTFAGGIDDEAKDYEDVELTTREDISEFQKLGMASFLSINCKSSYYHYKEWKRP